jgi:PcaR/PcaU/PobR family beta-ketoadipate pathway transcriptional regulator
MVDRDKALDDAAVADPPDGSRGSLFVASVEKAFRVLHLFNGAKVELSFSDVAQRSGIGRSATQRFLYTLHTLGYLVQDPVSKGYRLSSKLLTLTQSYSRSDVLREKASALLEEANRRCEETVNLTVLDGTEVVYIVRFPSKHVVSVNLTVGTRLPAFCTAPGRVLLAQLEQGQLERILSESRLTKLTEMTETRPDRLRKILEQVRHQGYCISNQEAFVGDISVAAPVFDEEGQAVAAVNIAVPTPRWSMTRVQHKLMPVVREVASDLSAALGRSGRSG